MAKNKYIGGSPTEARREYAELDKKLQIAVGRLAKDYGIQEEMLWNALFKEGVIDNKITIGNSFHWYQEPSIVDDKQVKLFEGYGLDHIFDEYGNSVNPKRNILMQKDVHENEKGDYVNSGIVNVGYDALELLAAKIKQVNDYVKDEYNPKSKKDEFAITRGVYNRGEAGYRTAKSKGYDLSGYDQYDFYNSFVKGLRQKNKELDEYINGKEYESGASKEITNYIRNQYQSNGDVNEYTYNSQDSLKGVYNIDPLKYFEYPDIVREGEYLFDDDKENKFEEGGEVSDWVPSDSILKYIKDTEAFRENIYKDGKGKETIGYGFTDKKLLDKYRKKPISKKEADKIFEDELIPEFTKYLVDNTENFDELTDGQRDALFSYIYNIGVGNYKNKNPELHKALSDMDWKEVAQNIDFGYFDEDNSGLKKRRNYERELFGYKSDKDGNVYPIKEEEEDDTPSVSARDIEGKFGDTGYVGAGYDGKKVRVSKNMAKSAGISKDADPDKWYESVNPALNTDFISFAVDFIPTLGRMMDSNRERSGYDTATDFEEKMWKAYTNGDVSSLPKSKYRFDDDDDNAQYVGLPNEQAIIIQSLLDKKYIDGMLDKAYEDADEDKKRKIDLYRAAYNKLNESIFSNPGKWVIVNEEMSPFREAVFGDNYEKLYQTSGLGALKNFSVRWDPDAKMLDVKDDYDFNGKNIAEHIIPDRDVPLRIRERIKYSPNRGSIMRNKPKTLNEKRFERKFEGGGEVSKDETGAKYTYISSKDNTSVNGQGINENIHEEIKPNHSVGITEVVAGGIPVVGDGIMSKKFMYFFGGDDDYDESYDDDAPSWIHQKMKLSGNRGRSRSTTPTVMAFEDGGDVKQKQKKAYEYFTNKRGMSKIQALAILGNLMAESELEDDVYGDNNSSYGIQQWHNERMDKLFQHARKKGHSTPSFEDQLEFLADEYEGKTGYTNFLYTRRGQDGPGYYNYSKMDFQNAENLHDAVVAWNQGAGRPHKSVIRNEDRYNAALDVAKNLGLEMEDEGARLYGQMGFGEDVERHPNVQPSAVPETAAQEATGTPVDPEQPYDERFKTWAETYGKDIMSHLLSLQEENESLKQESGMKYKQYQKDLEEDKKRALIAAVLPNIQLKIKGVSKS